MFFLANFSVCKFEILLKAFLSLRNFTLKQAFYLFDGNKLKIYKSSLNVQFLEIQS